MFKGYRWCMNCGGLVVYNRAEWCGPGPYPCDACGSANGRPFEDLEREAVDLRDLCKLLEHSLASLNGHIADDDANEALMQYAEMFGDDAERARVRKLREAKEQEHGA